MSRPSRIIYECGHIVEGPHAPDASEIEGTCPEEPEGRDSRPNCDKPWPPSPRSIFKPRCERHQTGNFSTLDRVVNLRSRLTSLWTKIARETPDRSQTSTAPSDTVSDLQYEELMSRRGYPECDMDDCSRPVMIDQRGRRLSTCEAHMGRSAWRKYRFIFVENMRSLFDREGREA